MTSYFEALGLERGASLAEIKKAFSAIARELHPDTNPDPKALEKFKLVSAAYNALSKDDGIAGTWADQGFRPWQTQWDALNPKPRSESDAGFVLDDLEQMIRNMERMRREANRQRAKEQAQRDEDSYFARQAEAARKARWANQQAERMAADARERAEREAQERREQQREHEQGAGARWTYGDNQRAEGKCGAFTKSGPCVRPEGHTPNGHMSQKVKDQKYENYKRRQGRS